MPLPRTVMSRAAALVAGALVAGVLGWAAPSHALSARAGLTGVVTGVGQPLASAWVSATPVDDSGTPIAAPRSAFTDASGRYVFDDLDSGSVILLVRAPAGSGLVDTWYPGVPTASQASPIKISATPTSADVTLPQGGSVIGRLVDATTGAPVEGTVRAVLADAPAAGSVGSRWYPGTPGYEALGQDEFGRPGDFALSGLPPQPVQLVVELPAGSPWLPEPVTSIGDGSDGSAGSLGSAGSVVVDGSRGTTGVVLALQRGAEIRGTVRDDSGAPVTGATVRLVGCGAGCPPPATSTASGAYRILGVRPGTRVQVEAERAGDLLTQRYPRGDTPAAATRLRSKPGEVIPSVDFTLTRTSHLSVQIRSSRRDEPLRVVVRLAGPSLTYHQYLAHSPVADTRNDGGAGGAPPDEPIQLRVGPVPPGDYVVRITPGMPDPGHLPTRWVTETRAGTSPAGAVGTVRLTPGRVAQVIADAPPPGGSTVATPAVGTPSVGTPPVGTPSVGTPSVGTPSVGTPPVGTPPVPRPSIGTPSTGSRPEASGAWPGLPKGFLGADVWPGWLEQGGGRPLADDLARYTP